MKHGGSIMNENKIKGALMVFGACHKIRLRRFMEQSGLSQSDIDYLIENRYCFYDEDSDGDSVLIITEKGKNFAYER